MKKILKYFSVFNFLLCIGTSTASHLREEKEQNEDKRPPYMRLTQAYGKDQQGRPVVYYEPGAEGWSAGHVISGQKKLSFSYSDCDVVIPQDFDPHDMHAQHKALEDFFDSKNKDNINFKLRLIVYPTEKSSRNPVVVLWLHGSGGPDDYPPMIQEFLEQGFAFATFPRFSSKIVHYSSHSTESFQSSWECQDKIALISSEIPMVYRACQKLIEHGTGEIILAGHSRGGILAFTCAMEPYASKFRDIKSKNGNCGSVKGYIPVSALPFCVLPHGLTQKEPVGIFHGEDDGICSFRVMQSYFNSLDPNQRNVSFFPEEGGHLLWNGTPRGIGSLFGVWFHDVWAYKFSPQRWFTHTTRNFFVGAKELLRGKPWSIRTWKSGAQNFNNACIRIGDRWSNFQPIAEPETQYTISEISGYIKEKKTTGFESLEKTGTPDEEMEIIKKIVDFAGRRCTSALK